MFSRSALKIHLTWVARLCLSGGNIALAILLCYSSSCLKCASNTHTKKHKYLHIASKVKFTGPAKLSKYLT